MTKQNRGAIGQDAQATSMTAVTFTYFLKCHYLSNENNHLTRCLHDSKYDKEPEQSLDLAQRWEITVITIYYV